MAKLAGWPEHYWSSINLNEFETQAKIFEAGPQKAFDKIVNYMLGSNSYAVARLKELLIWIDDGAYHDIIGRAKTLR
jgi:hypothetical protein